MRARSFVMALVLTLNVLPAHAASVTQVNRYATVENKALPEQVNPLKSVQQIHFPQEVQTVGDAVLYWLQHSGFHLASKEKQGDSLKQVLCAPLPQVDRKLGPLSIESGLLVLVGQGDFVLKTNTITREVNFQLKGTIV